MEIVLRINELRETLQRLLNDQSQDHDDHEMDIDPSEEDVKIFDLTK